MSGCRGSWSRQGTFKYNARDVRSGGARRAKARRALRGLGLRRSPLSLSQPSAKLEQLLNQSGWHGTATARVSTRWGTFIFLPSSSVVVSFVLVIFKFHHPSVHDVCPILRCHTICCLSRNCTSYHSSVNSPPSTRVR